MSLELRASGYALLAGLFAAGILFTYAQLQSPPAPVDSQAVESGVSPPVDSGDVITGSHYFQMSCTRCHGEDGEGENGAPTLHKEDMSDSEMAETIKNGDSPMPAFGGKYNASQIDDLLTFIHTLK
jgi:mono/diheme cytochrome c family protein